MNIEEIKERLSELEPGKVIKYNNTMDLATKYFMEYRNDVRYLLSIIELLEQDLTYMKQYGELTNLDGKMRFCIERALHAIRGG